MGWAGSAQLTGPDTAPKGLGRSRPNKISFLVWARPSPNSRAGPESVWPTNTSELGQNQPGPTKESHQCWARTSLAQHQKTNGGDYFPPSHPPICITFVLHAGGNTGNKRNEGGRKVYLAQRRRCRGSRTATDYS